MCYTPLSLEPSFVYAAWTANDNGNTARVCIHRAKTITNLPLPSNLVGHTHLHMHRVLGQVRHGRPCFREAVPPIGAKRGRQRRGSHPLVPLAANSRGPERAADPRSYPRDRHQVHLVFYPVRLRVNRPACLSLEVVCTPLRP